MGKSVVMSSGYLLSTANTTAYGEIGGDINLATSEAQVQVPWRQAGVISNFCVLIFSNSVNAISSIRLRKNGANVNSICSIPANGTGYIEDTTNTDTIAAGDKLNFMLTHGAATGTIALIMVSYVFTPTDGTKTVSRFVQNVLASHNASVVFHDALIGPLHNVNTTIGNVQVTPRIAGTFKHFAIYSNNSGRAFGIRMPKNSTDDSVDRGTIGSGVSGLLEDTSSSVAIDNDDTISLLHVYGGSGTSRNINFIAVSFETLTEHFLFLLGDGEGTTFPAGNTSYLPPSGRLGYITTNETVAKSRARIPMNISKLGVRITANTVNTGTSTVTLRKNGVDTALQASFGAGGGGIGYFEDTSDVVTFAENDEISVKFTVAGSSGAITPRTVTMLAEYISVIPPIDATSDHKDVLRQRPQQLITNSI